MPHLDYFHKSDGYIDFRIRCDADYWSAVRQLMKVFGNSLAYKQATRTFSVPLNSRSLVRLPLVFPEDWEAIIATGADEIDFLAREGKAER